MESRFGTRVVRCYENRPKSIYAMLADAIAKWPTAEAVVDGDIRLSYSELGACVNRFTLRLERCGVRPGHRVAVLVENSTRFLCVLYAVARIGGILVPINTREKAPGITYLLDHSGASVLVFSPRFGGNVPDLGDALMTIEFDDQELLRLANLQGEDLPSGAYETNEDDTAILLYTSGTTGRPKGAKLSHAGLVMAAMNYVHLFGMEGADRSGVPAPMSHVTGITGGILPMPLVGGCVLIVPEFKAAAFLKFAADERMNVVVMVPAMYSLCLLQPEIHSLDLSNWRIGAFGGAPMAGSTIEALNDVLPGLKLFNAYGATETLGALVICPSSHALAKRETIGVPIPMADVVIMNEDGVECEIGEVGELWLSAASVSAGYWEDEAATLREFVGGFWKSGDLGAKDEDGFIRLLDRKKDMLNRGGFKIYSAEVEQVIMSVPGVLEAAVVGNSCPVLGERIHAFVTLEDGHDVVDRTLWEACSANLSDYKVPESWTISYTPLPRNANGKLIKMALRERLQSDPQI